MSKRTKTMQVQIEQSYVKAKKICRSLLVHNFSHNQSIVNMLIQKVKIKLRNKGYLQASCPPGNVTFIVNAHEILHLFQPRPQLLPGKLPKNFIYFAFQVFNIFNLCFFHYSDYSKPNEYVHSIDNFTHHSQAFFS